MRITVRRALGLVAVVGLLCGLYYPRWRLCSREIGHSAELEAKLRGLALELEIDAGTARSKGDAKRASKLTEMAEKAIRLADHQAASQREWAWSRLVPFGPHPRKETEKN